MDRTYDNGLYPSFKAYHTGYLNVGDGHTLYYELSGNPKGTPVLYLHGGPGAGCSAGQRRYFNPDQYLIVQFDQRGAGRSTPQASTKSNTTDHLIQDIEALRNHFKIEKWLVAGGSWGATLALAYGQCHARACLGFLLRGVFLGTDNEVDWFLNGMRKIFPEAHRGFSDHVDGAKGPALLKAYEERLNDPDPIRHLPAARAWARYEIQCSTLHPQDAPTGGAAFDVYALALARLEIHYFKHKMFLEPDQLIRDLDSIRHLPLTIVQGRYDMVCPIETADRLHLAWPGSKFVIAPNAGHSGLEPPIAKALAKAADAFLVNFT